MEELDGAANQVDYAERWEELPIYHRTVYQFSDFNCHQKHDRSYVLNVNQMPVCARDVGIFIGASGALLLMSLKRGGKDFKDILLETMNLDLSMAETKKVAVLIMLGAVFSLPLILDGGIQLVTDYESFNGLRTFTGLLFGFGFFSFISAILLSASPVGEYQDFD